MAGPLAGVKVLDFTAYQQGPQATVALADMGAQVTKVEPPLLGDLGRYMALLDEPERFSAYFLAHNRGKRSITLNLKTEEGQQIAHRLAESADVAVHNFRPGVAERLGIGYNELRRANPRIIYAHASGWGSRGPKAELPCFDITAQARGGLISVTGEPDGYPLPAGTAVADYTGAMNLALAIVAALYARERTGAGQKVEASLLGAQVAMQAWQLQYFLLSGQDPGRAGRGGTYLPTIWRVFKTADGHAVIGGMPENRWPSFCQAVGRPELATDPRFENFFVRRLHLDELYAILDPIFVGRSTAEWLETLEAVDTVCAPVATYADVAVDPQVRENEYIVEVDHHLLGRIPMVAHAFSFSETPAQPAASAPELGQHTEEVLSELGYTWEEIGALREKQVI
jgi:crotonobetainyl-CoA:carnitine CoA-transferase CaiB-like acyl-CoA transferase